MAKIYLIIAGGVAKTQFRKQFVYQSLSLFSADAEKIQLPLHKETFSAIQLDTRKPFLYNIVVFSSISETGGFYMKTKLIAFLALLTLVLTACNTNAPNLLYSSEKVSVSILDTLYDPQYVSYEYVTLAEHVAYTKNTVILTGIASNIREATVEYVYLGTNVTDHITIFDIAISSILSCNTDSFPQEKVVSVGIPYNMLTYGEGNPILQNGSSYLMYCYVTSDLENDVLELAEYVDCWVSDPLNLLIEQVGDCYFTSNFFSNVPSAQQISAVFGPEDQNLEIIPSLESDSIDSFFQDISINPSTDSLDKETAISALKVLRSRVREQSTQWDYLCQNSFLINCEDLESFIQNKAISIIE